MGARHLLHRIFPHPDLPLEYQPAHSPEEFIQIAAGAAHLPRHAIRQKLFASPVMDAPQFARIMEHAYRQMWKHFISSPF
jgi:hypothetical protein